MELRELRSFCAAAKLRSISKAAEQLGMGQPTVTMHIKKLEKEFGVALFDRVKRPIQLTLAGAALAELAVPLVEGLDNLVVRTTQAEEVGPVRLAATTDIIPHTLLLAVRAFLLSHPHIHLHIRSETRREVLQMVRDGEVDLGLVPGAESGADIEFEGLFAYERVLITPQGHPLAKEPLTSLAQIARWPLILMRQGSYTRTILEEEFRRRGLSYEIVVELDSMDTIKRYVAVGMGISVGPGLAIDPEDTEKLGITSMATLLPVEQAGVVTLRRKALSAPAQSFMSVMRDTLAAISTVSGYGMSRGR
ncbi:MAG: LysR family transcriptional regulator [Dehalococcoidia bacterium]|nr:LysR family transcriptional regulator [Dehalococcoidia bacterium]